MIRKINFGKILGQRRGLMYNFLLLLVILIVLIQMFAVLDAKKASRLEPDPPLGTRADAVFDTLGRAELLQVQFQSLARESLCSSSATVGEIAQRALDHDLLRTEEDLFALYEMRFNSLAQQLIAQRQAEQDAFLFKARDQGRTELYEKVLYPPSRALSPSAPFYLYATEEDTTAFSPLLWELEVKSRDLETENLEQSQDLQDAVVSDDTAYILERKAVHRVAVQPRATTGVVLPLSPVIFTLDRMQQLRDDLETDARCHTTSQLATYCLHDDFVNISQQLYDAYSGAIELKLERFSFEEGKYVFDDFNPLPDSAPSDKPVPYRISFLVPAPQGCSVEQSFTLSLEGVVPVRVS